MEETSMARQNVSDTRSEKDNQYVKMAAAFKALSDPKRVKIIDLLSCGEMCGCVLLKCFEITQPTLAHDMKVLTDAGIVTSRREGKRTLYSLNWDAVEKMGKEDRRKYCDVWWPFYSSYDCQEVNKAFKNRLLGKER